MPILLACLVILSSILSWTATALADEPKVRLDQLIDQALAVNPQIEAARQQAEAARQQIPQAGALEDPMVGFGIVNLPDDFDFNAEDMTAKEISLSQKVPFFGKRRLSREAAEMRSGASNARIEETANQVVKAVKLTFFDLAHVYLAGEVTRRNKTILEDYFRLAKTRYSAGQGIQEDVVRAQVEISRMLDELLMLHQQRLFLEARMNMLLNRASGQALGEPAEIVFEPRELDVPRLQKTALETNPMLRELRSEVAAEEKAFSLADRDRYPDFNFRVAYGQRDNRPDMYSAMIEMNLPVYAGSKQNRKVEESAALVSAGRARFEAARNEIFFTIADMVSMAQRLHRQVELYRTGIIPQTILQIQSAMSAYTVNKADFMTLLDSRMRLFRFVLDYHQAITDYAKAIAEIEAATGAPLAGDKEQK